jgi:uncharacterized protein YybS (DUF2232 family)
MPLLLLFVPAFLGFVGAAWGTASFLVASFTAAAGLYLFTADTAYALYMLAAFLPASVILAFVLKGKRPYRYAVILMSTVFALFGYAIICLPSILAGNGPFDSATAVMSDLAKELIPQLGQIYADEEQVAFLQTLILMAVDAVPQAVATLILGCAEIFALLNTIISHWLLKHAKKEIRPMAPFLAWQLPKDFLWGAIILAAGAAACALIGLEGTPAVVAAVQCIIVPPYALMGLAFFEFSNALSPKRSPGWRVFIYVSFVLLLPYSLFMLAGFGLLDRVVNIRSRMIQKK